MSVRDLKAINVLNYNENTFVISTKNDGYALPPASNGNPSILPLTFDEISYINSNSEVFKSGLLRFPEEIEEEIYNELKISGWESILSNKDIENIILNPSIEGLTKIISIQNVANFDRVKGIFTRLKNEKIHDISIRVEGLIKERDSELRKGIRKSNIIVKKSDTEKLIAMDEVNSLKEQNKALQEQMDQMQKMLEQMMTKRATTAEVVDGSKTQEKKSTTPKKAGRPAKK